MVEFVLLGTAQDGGLPHAGCNCAQCGRARRDWSFRRHPAAAGVVSDGERLLIDATSAFADQLQLLWEWAGGKPETEGRHGAPETILITHAHTGHYVGLWQLDRSVMAANGARVVGPPRTIALLAANEPWATMQREGFLRLEPLEPNVAHPLLPDVNVTLLPVPHRAEWGADTVAVRVDGPAASVLYLPDIDQWHEWDVDLGEAVGSVSVAYLDGTFWDRPLRPGVPHPPVLETMERLEAAVAAGRTKVSFIHLNHSNPAVDPDSAEAEEVRRRGFSIGREGDAVRL
ncbi:MAG TPA: MBL fold metallo-hydrolase [Thermomicrobiales bacterium]|nr:MBL fold metallo-hydrolase [Thermomicrobiales bacterium]